MEVKEKSQTKRWLIEAFWELLKHKEYHAITISQIVNKAGLGRRTFYRYFKSKDELIEYTVKLFMNDFADIIMKNDATTQEMMIQSYFEFWELNIDLLKLLHKAHLLYFIEDHLLFFMYDIAIKIGHVPGLHDNEISSLYEAYKYEFSVKLGGLWKATILWSSEHPRKTPEEMSKLICSILR